MLGHKRNEIFIPSIVKAELFYGAEKSERKADAINKLKLFLEPFTIVEFRDKESLVYAQIRASLERQGSPIGPNDLIIAATVIANNGILITKNTKEFSRVNGLMIEDWTIG